GDGRPRPACGAGRAGRARVRGRGGRAGPAHGRGPAAAARPRPPDEGGGRDGRRPPRPRRAGRSDRRRQVGGASRVPGASLVRRSGFRREVNDMSTTETHRAVAPDIVSAAFKADPLPACAHLRAEQPVARVSVPGVSGEAYLVTRYEDAAAVLRDERFAKDVRNARDPGNLRLPWVPGALKPLMHTMLDSDGAEHHRLRGLVRDTFAPRYVAQLEPRVQQVAGDLVSRLAGAGEDGDRLSENELLAMVALLLIAGYETTVNLIATGTLLLLTHPGELVRLRQDPGLMGPAVEELLRLGSPVDVATERYAREDVEVAGVTIPRGSLVLVGIVSANTDDARFEERSEERR